MQTEKFCGLLGNEIAHSLSPGFHNHWAQQNQQSLRYISFELPESGNPISLLSELCKLRNFQGANVTIPFKTSVTRLDLWPADCHILALDRVQQAKAANTLFRLQPFHFHPAFHNVITEEIWELKKEIAKKNLWILQNTDIDGVIATFQALGFQPQSKVAVFILGAGGAARAAALAAEEFFRLKQLVLFSRSCESDTAATQTPEPTRSALLNASLNLDTKNLSELLQKVSEGCQRVLLINSLPLGRIDSHVPQNPFAQKFLEALNNLYQDKTRICYFDMAYSANHGCQIAEHMGIRNTNGLVMLKEQARRAFQLWTGILPQQ